MIFVNTELVQYVTTTNSLWMIRNLHFLYILIWTLNMTNCPINFTNSENEIYGSQKMQVTWSKSKVSQPFLSLSASNFILRQTSLNRVLSSDRLTAAVVFYLIDLSFVQTQMTSAVSDPLAPPRHPSQNPHTYSLSFYRNLKTLDKT